jgi:hypothetical protein
MDSFFRSSLLRVTGCAVRSRSCNHPSNAPWSIVESWHGDTGALSKLPGRRAATTRASLMIGIATHELLYRAVYFRLQHTHLPSVVKIMIESTTSLVRLVRASCKSTGNGPSAAQQFWNSQSVCRRSIVVRVILFAGATCAGGHTGATEA